MKVYMVGSWNSINATVMAKSPKDAVIQALTQKGLTAKILPYDSSRSDCITVTVTYARSLNSPMKQVGKYSLENMRPI